MLEWVIAGLFGLLIGSFLNVCIYRWPRDLSVVRPRSACIECGKPIAWYDNVPVLSYLILGARCRQCGACIHWRYPLVELFTAICFAYFVHQSGLSVEALKYCVFSSIVIALVFCDLDTLLLPDELTVGGFFIGLAFALFTAVPNKTAPDTTFHLIASLFGVLPGPRSGMLGEALLGAVVPAGSIWFGGWLFEKLRHKEGLGFGDVKMLAMVGAFLGIRGALLTIVLGAVAGSVVGLLFIKLTHKEAASYPLPFGSFLGAAALVAAVEGQSVIGWYVRSLP
jgi:leader peptidase (prepilin peptidase)/N-methyltransferase